MNKALVLVACVVLGCVEGYYYQHHYKDGKTLVKESFIAWNEAYRARNVTALASLYTDNAEIIPPGRPPVRGAAKYFRDIQISDTIVLTIERLVANCGNMVVARHRGRGLEPDGTQSLASGLRVFRIEGGVAKIKLSIWNSDLPTALQTQPKTPPGVASRVPYHQGPYYRRHPEQSGYPGGPLHYPHPSYRGYYNHLPYLGKPQYPGEHKHPALSKQTYFRGK